VQFFYYSRDTNELLAFGPHWLGPLPATLYCTNGDGMKIVGTESWIQVRGSRRTRKLRLLGCLALCWLLMPDEGQAKKVKPPDPPPHHFSCVTVPGFRYRLYLSTINSGRTLVAEAPSCAFDYVVPVKKRYLFWFAAVGADGTETLRKDAGVVVDGREAQP
jgi:hypothetical protein